MTPKKLSLIVLDHLPDTPGTHHGSFTGPSAFGTTLSGEFKAEITCTEDGSLLTRTVSITECYYQSGNRQTDVETDTVNRAEKELTVNNHP